MQKVERKQHKSGGPRRRLWLAAVFVLLAGSMTVLLLTGRVSEEMPVREEHSGTLISREAEELVSITVKRRGEEAWTLVRREDGTLAPEGGAEWTVTEAQGRLLQEAMTLLGYQEVLTEDPETYLADPASFGLESPLVTVTACYRDGTETTVHIGNDIGLDDGWYYMTVDGDNRLFAVSSGTVEGMNVEYALLHPVPKPEIYAALLDRITVSDADGNVIAEWALQGKISDRDAGTNWFVTMPFTSPADEGSIKNLKKNAENLRLGVFTADADEPLLEQYGLAHPSRKLTFHMAAGSTGTVSDTGVYDVQDHEEKTVVMYVGNARDEMADYVRYGDEIFTVSHFTIAVFSDPNPMNTVAKYPVLVPLASLESLTVEQEGETREYVIVDREQAEDEDETREVRLNGEMIPWDMFEAAYDRLLTVTYSGVLPQGAQWKEPYKKYTFRTLSGGTHTITLGDFDGMHDAVTVDGTTLFYLIKGGMTELPTAAQPSQSQ